MSSPRIFRSTPLIFFIFLPTLIWGHGYIKTPRSRNFVAYEDGKSWPHLEENPEKDNCPQCLNRGGTLARCGLKDSLNYDTPRNAKKGLLNANPQAVYFANEEITVDVVLMAHHKGHFVFKACAIEEFEVATQDCFDQHPLTFVEDLLYAAPVDVNHPERGYIAPITHSGIQYSSGESYLFSHKYLLPPGLTGDLVLLQWHYYTANTCVYEGYDAYPWPSSSWNPNLALCPEISSDGSGTPEQFWNCAEITILTGTVSPTTSAPTSPQLSPPPINSPVASPTPETACGGGSTGNGFCGDKKCCSYWGFCVTTNEFCGEPSEPSTSPPIDPPVAPPSTTSPVTHSPTDAPTPESSTPPPTTSPVTHIPTDAPIASTGTCGEGEVGNGICEDGNCCSEWGHCGSTEYDCAKHASSLIKIPVASSPQLCCPAGFTGFRDYDSCFKFYPCKDGVVTGEPLYCSPGALFDNDKQSCDWATNVDCAHSTCKRSLRGNK